MTVADSVILPTVFYSSMAFEVPRFLRDNRKATQSLGKKVAGWCLNELLSVRNDSITYDFLVLYTAFSATRVFSYFLSSCIKIRGSIAGNRLGLYCYSNDPVWFIWTFKTLYRVVKKQPTYI